MKKIYLFTAILFITLFQVKAQMGINKDGSAPHPSAILDVKASSSTNAKGLLMPRVADHTVITSPATGLMVFNTTTNTFWYYNGLAWTDMGNGGSSGAWLQNGTNVYTNNNNVGINTATPQTSLDIKGDGFLVSQKTISTTEDPNSFVRNMPLSDITYINLAGILYDPSGATAPYPSGSINTSTIIFTGSCTRGDTRGCNVIGIKLSFEVFDTEANGDSIIITDGTNTLAKYSGNILPPDFFFNGNALLIKFKTNGNSVVGEGFKIKWQAIERGGTGTSATINGVIGNSVFFNVGKGLFRSGNGATASSSLINMGDYSTGMGYGTVAKGIYATAFGNSTSAGSVASVAMGYGSNASGEFSTASGNYTNASTTASFASGLRTISGGYASTAMGYYSNASGYASTALGNYTNASGYNSTAIGTNSVASGFSSIALGYGNTAFGNNATAIGNNVNAYYEGSFVIGDSPNSSNLLYSPNLNTFSSRFRNGYYLYTSATLGTGAVLFGGGNSWSSISDSTKKENFLPINGENVLKKIANMRTVTWNYKGQDPKSFRHYGPMAQEFFNAFGRDKLGVIGNDTTIASADFDGVNFTAIKALEKRTAELQTENENLKKRLALLEKSSSQIMVLKAEMEQLKAFLLPEKEKIRVKTVSDK